MSHPGLRHLAATLLACATATSAFAAPAQQRSVAREWNELLLESIRNDFARPTVHARNLHHVSIAMWDGWATYDGSAETVLFQEKHAAAGAGVDALRSEAISHAAYRIPGSRFAARRVPPSCSRSTTS